MISQDRERLLKHAYARERARLDALAGRDAPQGDYAHPVFGAGDPDAQLLFVGEAPGREEAASGQPFVGKAGRHLDALLKTAGIERREAYVTNAVKYRPVVRGVRSVRNRTPGRREILEALAVLRLELAAVRPKTVVTLGNTPLAALMQLASLPPQTIGKLHGRPLPILLEPQLTVALFPLYHPASGIYNRMLLPAMEQDILALGEHLVNAR